MFNFCEQFDFVNAGTIAIYSLNTDNKGRHKMTHTTEKTEFKDIIFKMSGGDVSLCYQCGKCTAGCPMQCFMDLKPNQMMHLALLGDEQSVDELLSSESIWNCVTCETCTTRCPKDVKPSRVIDALRELAIERKKLSKRAANVIKFHKAFLDSIRFAGRVPEFFLIVDYKLRSKDFFQDITLAPTMFLRGKLHFFPHKIKGIDEIRKIFKKCLGE